MSINNEGLRVSSILSTKKQYYVGTSKLNGGMPGRNKLSEYLATV